MISRLFHQPLPFAGISNHLSIGRSEAAQRVIAFADEASRSSRPVLLTGESGTGRQLVAQLIHANGRTAAEPFLVFDCAQLSRDLLETELFGRGELAGAWRSREGLFTIAGKGTLLLENISLLPIALQLKLLQTLQQRAFLPAGSTLPAAWAGRLIATSTRNLEVEAKAGRFSSELLRFLTTLHIHVPALRERSDDIPALTEHFLALQKSGTRWKLNGLTSTKLVQQHWTGNVPELEECVVTACRLRSGLPVKEDKISNAAFVLADMMSTDSVEPTVTFLQSVEHSVYATLDRYEAAACR